MTEKKLYTIVKSQYLEELDPDSYSKLAQWRNEQMAHLRTDEPTCAEEQHDFHEYADNYYGIFDNSSLKAVVGLRINVNEQNAEISMIVEKDGELLKEIALYTLCTIGFAVKNLHKLYAYTYSNRNAKHRKVLEGFGFQEEGCLCRHRYKGGKLVDLYIHGLSEAKYHCYPTDIINQLDGEIKLDWWHG